MRIQQISVHVKTMDQLYSQFDPSPLENINFNKEVDEYITEQFDNVPITSLCNITLTIDNFDSSNILKVKKSTELSLTGLTLMIFHLQK